MQQLQSSVPPGRRTSRRPYNKSRLGCDSCKSRRVKCDEARPVCGNCKRYYADDVACQYGNQNAPVKPVMVSPQSTSFTMRPTKLDANNILALRLMHHYSVSFERDQPVSNFNCDILARHLWKTEIPAIAFTSEPVLYALLGISAWHLWSLNPSDAQLITTSRLYFGKALNLQRQALRPSEEVCDLSPSFIAGVVLAHLSWLLSSNPHHPDVQVSPLTTYRLCCGYRSLYPRVAADWSKKYTFLNIGSAPARPLGLSGHDDFSTPAAQDTTALLNFIENSGFDPTNIETYRAVIMELQRLYTMIADNALDVTTKEYLCVSLLHRVPLPFIRLLEREEPLAVGLMIRLYAVLARLGKLSSAWYLHGTDGFQVNVHAFRAIEKCFPREWLWLLDWPRRLVSNDASETKID